MSGNDQHQHSAYTTKLAEDFALFSTLTDYPREKKFDEVVAALEGNDDSIVAHEHLDLLDADELVELLQKKRLMALQQFGGAADLAAALSLLVLPRCGDNLGDEIFRQQVGRLMENARTMVESAEPKVAAAEADAPRG